MGIWFFLMGLLFFSPFSYSINFLSDCCSEWEKHEETMFIPRYPELAEAKKISDGIPISTEHHCKCCCSVLGSNDKKVHGCKLCFGFCNANYRCGESKSISMHPCRFCGATIGCKQICSCGFHSPVSCDLACGKFCLFEFCFLGNGCGAVCCSDDKIEEYSWCCCLGCIKFRKKPKKTIVDPKNFGDL